MRKTSTLIILVLLCLSYAVVAQQSSYSEAKSLLEKAKYNQKRGNLEGAIGHGLLGLDQAELIGNQKLIIEFKEVIGQIYLAKKEYKKAVHSFLGIVVSAERQNDLANLGKGSMLLANTYSSMGAYNKGSTYFNKAISVYKKTNQSRLNASAVQALGFNYFKSHQYSKSIETFENLLSLSISKSLYSYVKTAQKQLFEANIKVGKSNNAIKYGLDYYSRIKDSGSKAEQAKTTRQLAAQYIKIGDGKKALKYANLSIGIDGQNAESIESLAYAYASDKNYQKASQTFDQALAVNERKRNHAGIHRNYNQKAQVALDKGDERSALNLLQKAEKIGVERNTTVPKLETYRMFTSIYEFKGNEEQLQKYKSLYQQVKLQVGNGSSLRPLISSAKENLAESYEQEARAKISSLENRKLAQDRENLRAQQKLNDIEIIEQQGRLQTQELQQKELEAERAIQDLLIAEKTHETTQQQAELEKLQLDAEVQKLSEDEKEKAFQLLEKERFILQQQTDLQSQKIEGDKQAKLMYFLVIGATFLIVGILGIAFYRTYNNGKTIKEQNRNLAEQQKTILNRNIQLKKSSEAMLAMNNKLKKAHVNLKVLLKKEQTTKEELEQTNDDLKNTQVHLVQAEKMSSLGLLTAGIAHEINNPINFVSSGVQSLTDNFEEIDAFIENYQKVLALDDFDEIKKYSAMLQEDEDVLSELKDSSIELLEDVRYGIVRITEIVNGLKSFSRHDEAEVKESDVNQSFESALLILKNKYKNKVEIERDFDESLPLIQCFPGQLNQVFVNLINNSIDAIDEQGVIKIKTINIDNDSVELRISDNGSGMPKEVQAKIFDPFFTTKEIGKGTGLGLSISHGIIEKHKGAIRVESKVGEGTTFIINLPKKLEVDDKVLEENLNLS